MLLWLLNLDFAGSRGGTMMGLTASGTLSGFSGTIVKKVNKRAEGTLPAATGTIAKTVGKNTSGTLAAGRGVIESPDLPDATGTPYYWRRRRR